MQKLGLKQLLETFNEIKVRLDILKGKHDLKTYIELAKVSRDLIQPGVFNYASTEEISKSVMAELDEHKEKSVIGITKYIDEILDRLQERVLDGKRYDRLALGFNLLVDYALPTSYSEQAQLYAESLDEIVHSGKEMYEAYGDAA